MQRVAQCHGSKLVLGRGEWSRVKDVDVIGVGRAQRVAGTVHDVLHSIAHIGVHVGRNADVNDLSHQVTLTRVRKGTDQGVTPIAYDRFFFRHGAAGVEVRRQHVRVTAAIKRRFRRLWRVGCATGDEREQGECGEVPDHVPKGPL